ncbi:hypothetical protein L484_016941 [Morus notabilis]|uniref:Uncharacterized protein n=1 Tax=Morus notabilis TaxID=981085 RepID=W9R1N6_9ROSA|nr:hypothetical protein L484_016941 [Morus notabilis]
MGFSKPNSILVFVLLVLVLASQKSAAVQARTLSSAQQRYANVFATLGLVCKCGDGGEFTSAWNNSCSKVQCLPWKQHFQ